MTGTRRSDYTSEEMETLSKHARMAQQGGRMKDGMRKKKQLDWGPVRALWRSGGVPDLAAIIASHREATVWGKLTELRKGMKAADLRCV